MSWDEPRTWTEPEHPPLRYINALERVAHAARQTATMLERETPTVLDDALTELMRTPPLMSLRVSVRP